MTEVSYERTDCRQVMKKCVERWQPSHSSTCGGTDWTRRRAFWLLRRPSVSWQMAASKRRAPRCPQLPLIGSPCTHNTHHAHMQRLVVYERIEGQWRHGCFDLGGVKHSTSQLISGSHIYDWDWEVKPVSCLIPSFSRPHMLCPWHWTPNCSWWVRLALCMAALPSLVCECLWKCEWQVNCRTLQGKGSQFKLCGRDYRCWSQRFCCTIHPPDQNIIKYIIFWDTLTFKTIINYEFILVRRETFKWSNLHCWTYARSGWKHPQTIQSANSYNCEIDNNIAYRTSHFLTQFTFFLHHLLFLSHTHTNTH